MKKLLFTALSLALVAVFAVSCGGEKSTEAADSTEAAATEAPKAAASTESYDPKRGEGKFDESNTNIGALDAAMAAKGKSIAETKCFSCHKTTDERLVGPGWKGVSKKHTPHWIMNFITNPDPMIDKDPEVQAQLELCLVRMPNQNLAENEAREIVEFMRQNDGVK
jgi:mono/diheme cytochrome c family protein